jgi:capsular polysaccharide biosynthesis protein
MEMELKEYLSIIMKRIWLIIFLPVIVAAISAYVSFYVMDPIYEANTTLYIINKSSSPGLTIAYNDLLVGQQLVNDYKEIVKSRKITSKVIEELNLTGWSPSRLARKINVSAKNNTRVIEIVVSDSNPQLAKDIADKVAEVFKREAVNLMKVENVNIVDTAQLPENPVKPRHRMNIAVSFLIGLLAAIGIVFLVEYFDDTIKTADDVEKYLGLTVLGTIPEFSAK